ncbi:UDP-N-acetylmuramate--L-alanine ligase [Aeromicrobium sp. PE09-221]|uniref:UDP-N-acetylmuramate--L-alanine ligase n=1 Tax=Aeromicrobium sp. PE09-221 TaxID=1898043 RepID=UPI000B3E8CC3|nr:UDP-N-acetylmuramate--L-alanine ligase [Aeromicrobium sp. PE09-221]OUZ09532.1 UDP-N-acetylmuramate--L-alanine ligase [Aeromicrobium sp. PE09-221]
MRIPVPEHVLPAAELGTVHFIGIGGAGLSAIARIMAQRGLRVQGSDARDSEILEALRAEGIECFVGQSDEHIAGVDTVIASTAVREDNPEILAAQQRGVRLWPRSAGLAALMTPPTVTVAVAGTHGKTTTTAMLTCALQGAGADPSFAIGAQIPSLGTNARAGSDDVFVVEADESDGAFLHYHPQVALVTNVDADHLDVWGSVEAYEQAFADFIATVETTVVLGVDDPGAGRLAELARSVGLRVVTVGLDVPADVTAHDLRVERGRTLFTAAVGGVLVPLELAVPGHHYAQDALLALAAGWVLGHEPSALARGLGDYAGAARRMEYKGEAGGVRVYDSYAHHPTELVADLAAARQVADGARLVAVFQPHLVSRTRIFGSLMGQALSAADEVAVVDIYLAREDPDPEVTAQLVADAVTGVPAQAIGPVDEAADRLAALVRPGDVLVTLGAGDITEVGPRLLALLESR